jgi:hypothetical protein
MTVARWPRPLSEATMYSAEGVTEKRVREIIRQEIAAHALRNRCTCDCPDHPRSML